MVVDVYPEDEFRQGHLPALNIPLSQLEWRLADQKIVAYCRGPWCVLPFEAVGRHCYGNEVEPEARVG
jgi:rhodanese-related sulfurtransferase